MRLGNKGLILFIIFYMCNLPLIFAEQKIMTSPLINLENLEPSFEDIDIKNEEIINQDFIQNKKTKDIKSKSSSVKLYGLDKITAKTTEIEIKIGETKKFGPLEIKVLKCGKIKSRNHLDNVAYLQVIDTTKNQDEKVFIFNGWTFASDPTLAPFDHAIYDLQLINCNKI